MMPSERWKRIDDLIDDLAFTMGIGLLAVIVMGIAVAVAVRVFGGAA